MFFLRNPGEVQGLCPKIFATVTTRVSMLSLRTDLLTRFDAPILLYLRLLYLSTRSGAVGSFLRIVHRIKPLYSLSGGDPGFAYKLLFREPPSKKTRFQPGPRRFCYTQWNRRRHSSWRRILLHPRRHGEHFFCFPGNILEQVIKSCVICRKRGCPDYSFIDGGGRFRSLGKKEFFYPFEQRSILLKDFIGEHIDNGQGTSNDRRDEKNRLYDPHCPPGLCRACTDFSLE